MRTVSSRAGLAPNQSSGVRSGNQKGVKPPIQVMAAQPSLRDVTSVRLSQALFRRSKTRNQSSPPFLDRATQAAAGEHPLYRAQHLEKLEPLDEALSR